MQIRKGIEKDARQIAAVLASFYSMNLEEAKRTFLEEIRKGDYYIVAEENGGIIGLTTWSMHGLPKHRLAELHRIVLLPESRGKGRGRALFSALKKDADKEYGKYGLKLRKLYLLTHAGNKAAHAFYERVGFRHEAILRSHYHKAEDEWVFSMFFVKSRRPCGTQKKNNLF